MAEWDSWPDAGKPYKTHFVGTPEKVAAMEEAAARDFAKTNPAAWDKWDDAKTQDAARIKADIEATPTLDRFLAGWGKAAKETYGGWAMSPDEVRATRQRDEPLLQTGAGLAGNIIGNVVSAAPAAMLPGGASLLGALGYGTALGAMQPATSGMDRAENAAVSGGLSGAVTGAMRALPMLKKALIDPLFQSGQTRIALDTMRRFAADPSAIFRADVAQILPGSTRTLAEATGDAGIAQLQRAVQSASPEAASAFWQHQVDRNVARINALRDIAGEPEKRSFFVASRDTAAKELYERAFAETPTLTSWIKGEITKLEQRPAFGAALQQAQELAKNEGLKLDPSNVTQVLHYTKMALDDMIGAARGHEQRALLGTKDKLVSLMESKDFSPSYREARDTFSKMSEPINQMDVGEALYKKLQPALSDFSGTTSRSRPEAYAQAARELDQTVKTATGFRGAKAENVMSPEQLSTIKSIAADLASEVKAGGAGKVPGSPTAQYLAGQNLMKQIMGPLGLPQSWAESLMADMVTNRWLSLAAKPLEARIQAKLAEMLLNPQLARDAATSQSARDASRRGVNALADFSIPTLSIGAGSYAAQQ